MECECGAEICSGCGECHECCGTEICGNCGECESYCDNEPECDFS